MTNGVVLNTSSDEETEDAKSFSEEDEEEILIVIERDIHEFKYRQMMYWIFPYLSLSSIDIQEI